MKRASDIIGVIAAMFGCVALVVGLLFAIFTLLFLGGAANAPGTVTSFVGKNGVDYPIIQFAPHDTPITFTLNYNSSGEPYHLGDKVTVLYDSSNFKDARLDTFFSLWYIPTFMLAMGAGLLLVWAISALIARRR